MDKFLLSEMYRLELHWDKVKYDNPGICKIINAFFSGPVLSIASKIQPNQSIMLDFFKQYFILTRNVYVAKFSWVEVSYKDNKVFLKDTFLTHDTELNKVPKLSNKDYIVIDTKNHEEKVHDFNMFYTSYVVNKDGMLYKF